jgi:hypothetical protein
MSIRRPFIVTASFLLVAITGACLGNTTDGVRPTPSAPSPATSTPAASGMTKLVCGLPHSWLVRMWRGYSPQRSGELQILPKVPNFVGAGLPHVGPWDFTEDVPMLWYGPGHIKPLGPVQRPVTLADIAPTQAALLG